MLKNDYWIKQQAALGMIEPFEYDLIRMAFFVPKTGLGRHEPCLSYGTSSYGYDIRLSPKDFKIFRHVPGEVMDPKKFNPDFLGEAHLHTDPQCIGFDGDSPGQYFILPAHSYGLGVALEKLKVPPNVTVICLGKSTYARLGIIINTTPAEAGWEGHLTLEFSNSSGADCRVYASEGICQLLFLEGEPCETTYQDRRGKYQNQPERVVMARV